MAGPAADPENQVTGPETASETPPEARRSAGIDVDPGLAGGVRDAIEDDDAERLRALIAPVDAADLADLLQELDRGDRRAVVEEIGRDLLPDVLAELDETVREDVIDALGVTETAAAVADMETDDALLVIADLDEVEQKLVLQAIPQPDRGLLEQALAYPEGSAGRLMQRELVAAPVFWTVGDTIDDIRRTAEDSPDSLPDHFHDIFVVDPAHRPVGMVPLSILLRARRAVPLSTIMRTEFRPIDIHTDQADVALLFRKRDLTSAPVVDEGGRLLGIITIDDVVDVIDEEHEGELMHLGGVGTDDLYRATIDTARSRFTWLSVNLATAILASLVIGLFDDTIERMVALAVLMPIVASMGGNAGTQTLTVAVRGAGDARVDAGQRAAGDRQGIAGRRRQRVSVRGDRRRDRLGVVRRSGPGGDHRAGDDRQPDGRGPGRRQHPDRPGAVRGRPGGRVERFRDHGHRRHRVLRLPRSGGMAAGGPGRAGLTREDVTVRQKNPRLEMAFSH